MHSPAVTHSHEPWAGLRYWFEQASAPYGLQPVKPERDPSGARVVAR